MTGPTHAGPTPLPADDAGASALPQVPADMMVNFPLLPGLFDPMDERLETLRGSLDLIVNPPSIGEMVSPKESVFPVVRRAHREIVESARVAGTDPEAREAVELNALRLLGGIEHALGDYRWIVAKEVKPLPPDFYTKSYFTVGTAFIVEAVAFLRDLKEYGTEIPEKADLYDFLLERAQERIESAQPRGAKEWMEACHEHYSKIPIR